MILLLGLFAALLVLGGLAIAPILGLVRVAALFETTQDEPIFSSRIQVETAPSSPSYAGVPLTGEKVKEPRQVFTRQRRA